jgi:hypothetical protein
MRLCHFPYQMPLERGFSLQYLAQSLSTLYYSRWSNVVLELLTYRFFLISRFLGCENLSPTM